MNVEAIRQYCLSKKEATEDFPFDETVLAFRVRNKIFCMIDLDDTDWFVLKCDPAYAQDLRAAHPDTITGAWHMNKKYWNQLHHGEDLDDNLVRHLIDHSYEEVVKKLPHYVRQELMEETK